ncbi:MAG: aminotransferase class V-fold PLP-dependent enzyme [Peptostreptococcaceae bacterium]|nr:aminotransferase class V-fold PLP-dependent enzyme [Peptostreptococcaceae bacterium]
MIYLDNAATTFPKPGSVIEKMSEFMKNTMANPGRSGHKMAVDTNKEILETRIRLSRLIGAENPLQIAFTKNASEALNMAIFGSLHTGDHVITTMMEHNSVTRPLQKLKNDGVIEWSVVNGDHEGFIHADEILAQIRDDTALIAVTHAGNLLGSINDIEAIGNEIAKLNSQRDKPILFLVDCAQTVGIIPIDVQKMYIDLLAGAGHKSLYGPAGTGFLYIDENVDLEPIYRGGTGSNSESLNQPEFMPDMLETGTLNAVGIVGLGAGLDYINEQGIEQMMQKQQMLIGEAIRKLESIQGVKLYGTKDVAKRSGVLAFNIRDIGSQEITLRLSEEFGIATRGGLHCAPLAHSRMGTLEQGMVRASVSSFNTVEDIEVLADAVEKIAMEKE